MKTLVYAAPFVWMMTRILQGTCGDIAHVEQAAASTRAQLQILRPQYESLMIAPPYTRPPCTDDTDTVLLLGNGMS